MTVKENLQVFASLYRAPAAKTKIAELLNYFEISRMADQRYNDLSAGERTRVNLAKALLNDPELILMDEPTASLDPDIADKTLSLIEELRRDRAISILFTSHNMSEVERICDEVIFLYRGKIVSKDTPHNHMSRLDKATISLRYSGSRTALETCLRKQHVTYNEKDGQHVTIETTNSAIGALLESLAANNIRLLDIDIQKATLEDVFLDIARREKS